MSYFLLNNGLIRVYVEIDINHKNDKIHGIVNINKGIVKLLSYSESVQLHKDWVSCVISVILVMFIFKNINTYNCMIQV